MLKNNLSRSLAWLLGAALFLAAEVSGAIEWSGVPTQVYTGAGFGFGVYETAGGQTPPTVTLYKNGSFVGSGQQYFTYSGVAPSTPQTLTFLATSSYGGYSTRTIQVISANQSPIGAFDSLTASVYPGQSAVAQGWAADNEQGAPITRVDVYLDGVDIGDATLGGSRPDVANTYSRPDYTNSGWTFTISTGSLSQATHTVEVRLVDNNGAVTVKPSKTFTVSNTAPTTTSCSASSGVVLQGAQVTVTATTTDPQSNLTLHEIDYLAPGVSSWTPGSPNWSLSPNSSVWNGGPAASHTITTKKSLTIVGTWQFRARGRDSNGVYSSYKYVSVTVPDPNQDSDGDGMPDVWESQYGLNPNSSADALIDSDGDGLTNVDEYRAGRSPLNANDGGVFPTGFNLIIKTPSSPNYFKSAFPSWSLSASSGT